MTLMAWLSLVCLGVCAVGGSYVLMKMKKAEVGNVGKYG